MLWDLQAKTKKENTISFLSDYLNQDSSFVNNIPNITHFLGHLCGKIGYQQIFQDILKAEEEKCCKNETFFQRFLDLLRNKDQITAEEHQEFLHINNHDQKEPFEKNSSTFENCSAFSFHKPSKRNKNPFSFKTKNQRTPEFEFLNHNSKQHKLSKLSALSDKFHSFSEYSLENTENASLQSDKFLEDQNNFEKFIENSSSKEKKKPLIREKSVWFNMNYISF